MFILHDILEKLKNEFPQQSRNGQERATWFVPGPRKSVVNSLVDVLLRMAA